MGFENFDCRNPELKPNPTENQEKIEKQPFDYFCFFGAYFSKAGIGIKMAPRPSDIA